MHSLIFWVLILAVSSSLISSVENVFDRTDNGFLVPNIVHQTYDYQAPNFFLYMSLLCVQRFLSPEKHILWVNDEGRFRKGHWDGWQDRTTEGTWENDLKKLIQNGKIEVKFLAFPANPPGNTSIFAPNKAHRSDFVRMSVLDRMGGIYLDTDAFATQSLDSLRIHNFTLSFDNIVNPDKTAPKRLNNGVLLSSPNSKYLKLWMKEYSHFNPNSFDFDSSVVPYKLATEYPDLVNIEMWRLSPMSFGFQTNAAAEALTCGILLKPETSKHEYLDLTAKKTLKNGGIWRPRWDFGGRGYTYEGTSPDYYMYHQFTQKLVLHLTMTHVRGICMMRRALSPQSLDLMPSLMGRIFRIALYGEDKFDYQRYIDASVEEKNNYWKTCRDHFGMYLTKDPDDKDRQQYTEPII